MKQKKIVPYKLRKLVPIMGMAGASLMFGGCEKQEPEIEVKGLIKTVNLFFGPRDFTIFENGDIQNAANTYDICSVYLIPQSRWFAEYTSPEAIHEVVETYLKPAIEYSPKVRGQGNFDFLKKRIDVNDSLWIVQHGWTINKKNRYL